MVFHSHPYILKMALVNVLMLRILDPNIEKDMSKSKPCLVAKLAKKKQKRKVKNVQELNVKSHVQDKLKEP